MVSDRLKVIEMAIRDLDDYLALFPDGLRPTVVGDQKQLPQFANPIVVASFSRVDFGAKSEHKIHPLSHQNSEPQTFQSLLDWDS